MDRSSIDRASERWTPPFCACSASGGQELLQRKKMGHPIRCCADGVGMNVGGRVWTMWRGLVRREQVGKEVREELLFHVEARAERLMGQGMAEADAQRRARVELGVMVANGAEVHRRVTGMRLLDETWGDVRYGLRGLWRNKGFALTAILSLAIGIGATTAMFSVVYAVLLDVYPYADAERTVNPIVHDPGEPDDWNWFLLNPAQYAVYKASPAFEDVFAQGNLTINFDDEGLSQTVRVTPLSANAWAFNGVPALVGRTLGPADGDMGGKSASTAVLGFKYWKRHYGGDREVIGKDFKAGKSMFKIVGVMPERFTLGGAPDMYMPLSAFAADKPHYIAFAKLKKGVTAEQASAMVDPMLHQFAKEEPTWIPKNFHARLQLLLEGFTARSKLLKNFPLLYMAVGSLLLIGCANCSLLLLARGTTRVHEFALRAAVGAGRARMVRQLLVECVTISVIGSVLGTGLAYVLARVPLILADDLFPTETVIRVNGWVLLVAVGTAVLAGVGFGLLPALKFSRPEIGGMLNATGRRTVAGGSGPLRLLVGVQIALTLVLLTVSAAAVGGFVRVMRLPLGYDPSNALVIGANLMKDVAKTWPERVALAGAMQDALRRVPGVVSASVADSYLPEGGNRGIVHFEGEDGTKESHFFSGGADLLKTLRIPLVRGRIFTEAEWRQGLPVVVVNETFARRLSPGREVLDRALVIPMLDASKDQTSPELLVRSPAVQGGKVRVIGVAADAMNDGMENPVAPEIYEPSTLSMWPYLPFVVRTAGEPHRMEKALTQALHSVGVKVAVYILPNSMQEMVEHENVWRTQRLVAVLLGLFALGALALSLVGLYSVAAYGVAQRRAEFGISMALGAPREGILRLVVLQNAWVIAGGALVGVLLALVVRTRFAAWSEGSSRSLATVVVAAGLLVVTALGASLVPAWRASRVEPAEALRAE